LQLPHPASDWQRGRRNLFTFLQRCKNGGEAETPCARWSSGTAANMHRPAALGRITARLDRGLPTRFSHGTSNKVVHEVRKLFNGFSAEGRGFRRLIAVSQKV
jgi:hypothetical protein